MKNADMPAMPLTNSNGAPVHHSNVGMDNHGVMAGLTKREMIAMHAMQGILAAGNAYVFVVGDEAVAVAEFAVSCADALLAELERTQQP